MWKTGKNIIKHKRQKLIFFRRHAVMTAVLAMSLILGALAFRVHSTGVNMSTANASANSDLSTIWQNFPGATKTANGSIHFEALDRKIVNQDGSGGQADPAVNVAGSHLNFTGDFAVNLQMSNLNSNDSSFRLYRDVPNIYDEWRYDGTSVDVKLSDSSLKVDIWDGKSANPVSSRTYNLTNGTIAATKTTGGKRWYQFWRRSSKAVTSLKVSSTRQLSIQKVGKTLNILVDNSKIASLSASSLFTKGNLWFGADASGSGWDLDSMTLAGKATLQEATATKKTNADTNLGTLASRTRTDLKIGAAISIYPLMTDEAYRNLSLSQLNIWTPENAMKAQFIHPHKDTYSFEQADLIVDTAAANGITVHGHALVFGEANPVWMQKTAAGDMKKMMEDHITTIMKHYAGKVAEWDVVNEPLADYDAPEGAMGLRKSIWYNAIGESFVADALKTARLADPEAKLYINEFGLEADGDRWDTFIKLLQTLKANNVPLDGIGFQSHIYDTADKIDQTVLRKHIQQLSAMGLKSRISEIDVTGEDPAWQAEQYASVLTACKQEPSCTSYSTWGVTDLYGSTTIDHTYPPDVNDGLLWDANYKPKAAVTALINLLK